MSVSWREDDEEFKLGGKGSLKSKPRFSFNEVRVLLEAVKRNRYIILRKFNQGVSAETKKQTWAEITDQINSLGENRREVRQIMKKWADLKCDGKRRIAALRGPNGTRVSKKRLGPVEKMVHKILMMSPRGDGDSDPELADDEDISKIYGDPFHSSSDFDLPDDGEPSMDFDENEDSMFSTYNSSLPTPSSTSMEPLPSDSQLRLKPVHTYSRTGQTQTGSSGRPPGPGASTSSGFPLESEAVSTSAAPPLSHSPSSSTITASSIPASSSSSSSSSSAPPPASPSSSFAAASSQPLSSSHALPPPSAPSSSSGAASGSQLPLSSLPPPAKRPPDPLPPGAASMRTPERVALLASQSLQQQQASRVLLASVSRSLETLAQSVQLLVESQQEFVQESLLLQRETLDILKDFSSTALAMLRDKASGGRHHPTSHC